MECKHSHTVHDKGILVCTACGLVLDESNIVLDSEINHLFRPEQVSSICPIISKTSNFHSKSQSPRNSHKIKRDALETLERLLHGLSLPGLQDRVWYLYSQSKAAFGTRYGRETDVALAACIYAAAKESKHLLAFSTLSALIHQDEKFIKRFYAKLNSTLKKSLSEEDEGEDKDIPLHLLYQLTSKVNELNNINSSIQLWKLVVSNGLSSGRNRLPLWVACIYVCLESTEKKSLISLGSLCDLCGARISSCQKRVREIKKTLIQLSLKLPWVKDVAKKDVLTFLPDILRHNSHLSTEFSPPSFIVSALEYSRRCQKLKSARSRLQGEKSPHEMLDEEDVLMEGLLLRGASAESLEKLSLKQMKLLECDGKLPPE